MNEQQIPTVQEVVVDTLRQSIVEGKLKPGDRLVQDEIATRYGVSRIPVREAFRTLAAEGLVTFHPRRGVIVRELTREDVEEIIALRGILEGMVTRMAAEKATPAQLEVIRQWLEELEAARDDPDRYFQINYDFHGAILDAAHRPHFKALIMNLRNSMEPIARRYLAPAGRVEIAHADHKAIFEAIAQHDCETAERLASNHTKHVLVGILKDWRDPGEEEED